MSLLITPLDNAETILQGGDRAGQYREGYEEYGQLFESIGRVSHESCLLLTTREKPREIRRMPGQKPPVRCLDLKGLDSNEGREFVTAHRNKYSLLKMPSKQRRAFLFLSLGKHLTRYCAQETTRNMLAGATLAG